MEKPAIPGIWNIPPEDQAAEKRLRLPQGYLQAG
jgi:hypothetical protein